MIFLYILDFINIWNLHMEFIYYIYVKFHDFY